MTTDHEIAMVPISKIRIRPGNPNRMSAEKLELLERSIDTVGFIQPIIVSPDETTEGGYVLEDGEHRIKVMRKKRKKEILALVRHGDLTNADYQLVVRSAVNRIRGETDLTQTAEMFAELIKTGWHVEDLQVAGFTIQEITALVDATLQDVNDILHDAAPLPEEETAKPKRYALTLQFESEASRARVRAALLGAAGEGGSLADGLLTIIEEQE